MSFEPNRTYTATELLADLSADDLAILEQRQLELAKTGAEDDENAVALVRLLTFFIGNEIYGLPVDAIREVRPVRRITRVPSTPPFVVGVMNLRGNILSLINLRRFLGVSGETNGELRMVMVVEAQGLEVGILAEKVGEVVNLPFDEFKPTPLNTVASPYLNGVSGDGIILVNHISVLSDPNMIVNLEHV